MYMYIGFHLQICGTAEKADSLVNGAAVAKIERVENPKSPSAAAAAASSSIPSTVLSDTDTPPTQKAAVPPAVTPTVVAETADNQTETIPLSVPAQESCEKSETRHDSTAPVKGDDTCRSLSHTDLKKTSTTRNTCNDVRPTTVADNDNTKHESSDLPENNSCSPPSLKRKRLDDDVDSAMDTNEAPPSHESEKTHTNSAPGDIPSVNSPAALCNGNHSDTDSLLTEPTNNGSSTNKGTIAKSPPVTNGNVDEPAGGDSLSKPLPLMKNGILNGLEKMLESIDQNDKHAKLGNSGNNLKPASLPSKLTNSSGECTAIYEFSL